MKAPKTELVSLVTLGTKPQSDAKAPLAKILSQHKGTLPARSLWQQSDLTIDAFYQQLKTEIAQGWINPPAEAEMMVIEEDSVATATKGLLKQALNSLDESQTMSPRDVVKKMVAIVESTDETAPPPPTKRKRRR